MKKSMAFGIVLSLVMTLAVGGISWADPWAIVSNYGDRSIHTIDLGTDPPTVFGPFLEGQLGTAGQLLDVAVTPDGRYALVSNFRLGSVYRIDLSDPTDPVLAGSVDIGFAPQDIAIAPNGQSAVVVDGAGDNRMAIIDLDNFDLTTTYTLGTEGAGAGAVAIAPDNETVIICDYYNAEIIYGSLDPAVGLISENTLPTKGYPINVAISPDGETALVVSWFGNGKNTVNVFRITEPGTVEPGKTPTVNGLPFDHQSIAFSPDGQRAYVVSLNRSPDLFSWLRIDGPGEVKLGQRKVTRLLTDARDNGFYGTDILAITPDGSHALVGNPSTEVVDPPGLLEGVAMINLSDWSLREIPTGGFFPVGIAVFDQFQPALDSVYVDIRPFSRKNLLNVRSRGILPVAILGTELFDVRDIDPATIRLNRAETEGREATEEGVAPIRWWKYIDISTPLEEANPNCIELDPDGYEDLIMLFRTPQVVEAIGEVSDGEEVVLAITGFLTGGSEFEGEDFVTILKKGEEEKEKEKKKRRRRRRRRRRNKK